MSGLSSEDVEALAEFAEHADWCDYAEKSADGCTPEFGCGIWKVRDRLAAVVEAIVTRAVNEALTEAADAIEERRAIRQGGWEIDLGEREIYIDAAAIVRARNT